MRPVVRGKNTKVFKDYDYKDARGDLIEKLGEYCSYCEMRIPSSLDVEHILPKSQFPDEETSTASRKSKVKSQKSKRIYNELSSSLEWSIYFRRPVLVGKTFV